MRAKTVLISESDSIFGGEPMKSAGTLIAILLLVAPSAVFAAEDGDVILLLELDGGRSFHGFSSLPSQMFSGFSSEPGGISAT